MTETYDLEFSGRVLRRGFWLYVWQATTPGGEKLHYVGRTGDNSTPNAQSPFVRMGQHLGYSKNSNMLRKHLVERGVDPEECTFRLIAHGPIFPEVPDRDMEQHKAARNVVGALEKQLADDLVAAGYDVMNTVNCAWPLDEHQYNPVRAAFAGELPGL